MVGEVLPDGRPSLCTGALPDDEDELPPPLLLLPPPAPGPGTFADLGGGGGSSGGGGPGSRGPTCKCLAEVEILRNNDDSQEGSKEVIRTC